jgi:hypothetical protein
MAKGYVQECWDQEVGGVIILIKRSFIIMFRTLISILILFSLIINSFSNVLADPGVNLDDDEEGECKVIVVMNNSTAGDYNLHMKVRDPSRTGGQVLFMLEPGYNYSYHHPLTGEVINFTVKHKIIGTATAGDIPPNLLKPGMVLTSAGISIGDADNPTLQHVNKNATAWDDFDWMRFAFQTADSEDEAVRLLTEVAVDELHATSIGETLFVVGPDKGYAIEADADHYYVHEIEDFYMKSNYAEFLWEQCSYFKNKYAPTFETKFNGWVRVNQTIKLGPNCSRGVKIVNITQWNITAQPYPDDGTLVTFNLFPNQSVGNFRVNLHNIKYKSVSENDYEFMANISVCYKYLEWRDWYYYLFEIEKNMGKISLEHLIYWSKRHTKLTYGLRPFCEGSETRQEAVNIFKHPVVGSEILGSLWYAGIPCSSVYVPVHIGSKDIYEPFKTGEAWHLSLALLQNYSHGNLKDRLGEGLIISENDEIESICFGLLKQKKNETISDLLTYSDLLCQFYGFMEEKILLKLAPYKDEWKRQIFKEIRNTGGSTFNNYLTNIRSLIPKIEEDLEIINKSLTEIDKNMYRDLREFRDMFIEFMNTTVHYKIKQAEIMVGFENHSLNISRNFYQKGYNNTQHSNFTGAAENFLIAFQIAEALVKNLTIPHVDIDNKKQDDKKPEDNPDDEEKEPDIDGGYDPDDVEPTETNDTDDTKDQRPNWSRVDYMLITGIILLVIILVGINVSRKRKK